MKIIITENQYNRIQIITEGKNIKESYSTYFVLFFRFFLRKKAYA
jgi:hypothetical protein